MALTRTPPLLCDGAFADLRTGDAKMGVRPLSKNHVYKGSNYNNDIMIINDVVIMY